MKKRSSTILSSMRYSPRLSRKSSSPRKRSPRKIQSLNLSANSAENLVSPRLFNFLTNQSNQFDTSGPLDILKVKLLGKGGSGTQVWCVKVNGWKACMKELPKRNVNEAGLDEFKKEIEILSNLPNKNPHLIRFLGYKDSTEYIRIFMTLYDGSLNNVIANFKEKNMKFSEELIIQIMIQLLRALTVLHNNLGIIHRDIKSHNIFYEGDIEQFFTKDKVTITLGDFGECKVISPRDYPKTCVGTADWMAPEVVMSSNKKAYTFAADIWSLGMVMYEMMALECPYYDYKLFAAQKQMLSGGLPTIHSLQRKRYSRILTVWKKMLAFNHEERPTAVDLLVTFSDLDDVDVSSDTRYVDHLDLNLKDDRISKEYIMDFL